MYGDVRPRIRLVPAGPSSDPTVDSRLPIADHRPPAKVVVHGGKASEPKLVKSIEISRISQNRARRTRRHYLHCVQQLNSERVPIFAETYVLLCAPKPANPFRLRPRKSGSYPEKAAAKAISFIFLIFSCLASKNGLFRKQTNRHGTAPFGSGWTPVRGGRTARRDPKWRSSGFGRRCSP